MRAVASTFTAIAGLAFLGVASIADAQATTVRWNFQDTACTHDCSTDGPNGNTRTFIGDDGLTSVTVSAWALTGNTGSEYDVLFESAFLGHYGQGLGVTDREEDPSNAQHTMDNVGDEKNVIAFLFDTAVTPTYALLNAFQAYGVSDDPDTDISVWIGNWDTINPFSLAGLRVEDLSDPNGLDLGPRIDNDGVNGDSSRWSHFGDGRSGNLLIIGASLSDTSPEDMIKIGVVKAEISDEPHEEVPNVMEPASLAVFGLGIFGMASLRRRRKVAG